MFKRGAEAHLRERRDIPAVAVRRRPLPLSHGGRLRLVECGGSLPPGDCPGLASHGYRRGRDLIKQPPHDGFELPDRLLRKGVPFLRSSGRGDQLVIINMEVPTRLSSEQRDLFEKLAGTLGSGGLPQEKGFIDLLRDVFGG